RERSDRMVRSHMWTALLLSRASTHSGSVCCASATRISSAASARTRLFSRSTYPRICVNRQIGLPRELHLMLRVIEFEPHYDAIIVGARCAGAATAMLLARAGLRVLAVDRQSYGSDTLSTHALMRPAVMQLSRWGLLQPLIQSGAPLIGSTTFHYGE